MEKEASLLRCSKLSCYGEFNRMVQAISRNRAVSDIPGMTPKRGTSAEYHFYTTLVLMLKGVVNNTDPVAQKQELQQVYKWFCMNKPLIKSKTKPTHSKPKVSLARRSNREDEQILLNDFDRPQTAPAVLNQPQSFVTSSASWRRPHTHGTHRQRTKTPTFTSSYISRSLSKDLDLIGQPLDQLQLDNNTHQNSLRSTTPEYCNPNRKTSPPVIAFPTPEFLAGYNPLSGQDFSDQRPATVGAVPVTIGTVFSLAPNVAAQMTLNRELKQHKQMMMQRRVQSSQPLVQKRQLLNTPNELERAPQQDNVPISKDSEIKQGSPENVDVFESEEQATVNMRVQSRVDTPDQVQTDMQSGKNERAVSSRLQQVRTSSQPIDRKIKKHPYLHFHHSQSGTHQPDIGELKIKGHTLHLGESGRQDSSSFSVVNSKISHPHSERKDDVSTFDLEFEDDQDTRHPVSSATLEDSPVESQKKLRQQPVNEKQFENWKDPEQSHPSNEPQLQVEDVLQSETSEEHLVDEDVLTLQAEDLEDLLTNGSSTKAQTDAQATKDDQNDGNHELSQTPQPTESTISSKQFQTVSTDSVPASPVPTVTIRSPSTPGQNLRSNGEVFAHQRSLPMNVVSISFQPKSTTQTTSSPVTQLQTHPAANRICSSQAVSRSGSSGSTSLRKKTPNICGAGFNRRRYQRQRTVNIPIT